MQKAAAISTVSWISRSVAPQPRAAATSSMVTVLPPVCTLAAIAQQGAELVADRRLLGIALDLLDEGASAVELHRGEGAVGGLAEDAVVEARHVRRDQLALAAAERVVLAQEDLRELGERHSGLGTKRHRAADAGNPLGKVDVRHGVLLFAGWFLARMRRGGSEPPLTYSFEFGLFFPD